MARCDADSLLTKPSRTDTQQISLHLRFSRRCLFSRQLSKRYKQAKNPDKMANATTNARTAVLFNGAANTVNQTRATLGTAGCFRLAKDHLLPSMAPNVFTAVAGEDYVRIEPRQMAYRPGQGLDRAAQDRPLFRA